MESVHEVYARENAGGEGARDRPRRGVKSRKSANGRRGRYLTHADGYSAAWPGVFVAAAVCGWRMADVRAHAATPLRQGSFSLVLFIVAAWGGGQLASIV